MPDGRQYACRCAADHGAAGEEFSRGRRAAYAAELFAYPGAGNTAAELVGTPGQVGDQHVTDLRIDVECVGYNLMDTVLHFRAGSACAGLAPRFEGGPQQACRFLTLPAMMFEGVEVVILGGVELQLGRAMHSAVEKQDEQCEYTPPNCQELGFARRRTYAAPTGVFGRKIARL